VNLARPFAILDCDAHKIEIWKQGRERGFAEIRHRRVIWRIASTLWR